MNKRHLAVIFGALVLSVFLVLATIVTVRKFKASNDASKREADISSHAELLAGLEGDYMVYYIGEPSAEVRAGIPNLTVLTPELINNVTMPIKWSDIHSIERDSSGNIINEVVPRDYPSYMLIYVGSDVSLTEEQLEIIRNCNCENDVPLIIEGEANINAYRAYIFMVHHDLGDHATTMFVPWSGPVDNIIPEETVTGDQAMFVNALIDVLISNAEQIDDYRIDSTVFIETESTIPPETESTDET
ncbi:MAG: hypothetical protein MJ103_02025 [Saccharofermentans sp.]|nr:hypothetical protein [Saccharofermentans sp.]